MTPSLDHVIVALGIARTWQVMLISFIFELYVSFNDRVNVGLKSAESPLLNTSRVALVEVSPEAFRAQHLYTPESSTVTDANSNEHNPFN